MRWRVSGASASAGYGPSPGPQPSTPRKCAAAAAVRPPRPDANPQRPSQEARPQVRSPRHAHPRPRSRPASSWRPTCPSVLVPSVIVPSQAHLTHVGALSSRATRARIRAVIRHHRRRLRPAVPVFPSPFGIPALACCVILRPLRTSALLTVGLPGHTGLDLNGVATFRRRKTRSGWASPLSRGGGVLPAGRA